MNGKAFVIALVAAILAFSLSAALGIWPFGRPATEKWLEKIGLPEGAAYVGAPEISDMDGTKPEMLLQEVAMEGDPAGIRQEFLKRCVSAGLVDSGAAGSGSTAQSPLCQNKPGSETLDFIVDVRCEGAKCRVFLELHKFGI